jgi:hypothetical protein
MGKNMTNEMMQYINSGLIGIIMVLIGIVGFFLKSSLDNINKRLEEIENKMVVDNENLIKNYALKDELEKGSTAREKIWIEVNSIRERIAKGGL